jgi:hypothetical protein
MCVSDDCVCSPHLSSSSPSPSTVPSFSFSSPSSPPYIPPNLTSTPSQSPSKKFSPSSGSSSSTSSVLSKFSNVFSCCQVGPPEEDVELFRHLSYSLITPPVNLVKENKGNVSELDNNIDMNESIIPFDSKKLKSRKVKRDDSENEFLETE